MELFIHFSEEELNLAALQALLREAGVAAVKQRGAPEAGASQGQTTEVKQHAASEEQSEAVRAGGALPPRLLR